MTYIPATPADRATMLAAIGVDDVEQLFASIPADLRLTRPLDLPPSLGEIELRRHLSDLAGVNYSGRLICFAGAGAYDHYCPAAIDAIAGRGEFLTAYTPYQPEVSQGTLAVIFEFQTFIARLTGLDVANAGLYDGASACAEACLMALRAAKRRTKVILAGAIHPDTAAVVRTYLAGQEVEIVAVPTAEITRAIDDRTAAVMVQNPDFAGRCLDLTGWAEAIHERGAYLIASCDPISLALLKPPGAWGCDIAVGEAQGLGTPLSFGGPYLGYLACSQKLVRQIPGRLVGKTVDRRGNPGFVLTLQAREQHIKRERATSNICTNQSLLALRATVYLALLGPHGLAQVAAASHDGAQRLHTALVALDGVTTPDDKPHFKEFVLHLPMATDRFCAAMAERGILAGVPISRWDRSRPNDLLVAVTERRSQADLETYVTAAREVLASPGARD
jgi:glycine dehydrogenase subunit 1